MAEVSVDVTSMTALHGIKNFEQNHLCQKSVGVWCNGLAWLGGWHCFETSFFHSVFPLADSFVRNTINSAKLVKTFCSWKFPPCLAILTLVWKSHGLFPF